MVTESKVGRLVTEWDEVDVVDGEVKYRLENWDEAASGPKPSEEEARKDVLEDDTVFEFAYEAMLEEMTALMMKKNKGPYWYAEVKNFGWQSLSGHRVFKAEKGREFLLAILPKTDCRFKVFNCVKGIAVQNWHHDSPVGKEWYRVMPISEERFLAEGGN